MSHKAKLLGAAASIVLLSAGANTANAEHFSGWYVGAEGGANWVQDFDANIKFGTPSPSNTRQTYEMNTGWAALATIGYGFGWHWRAELEGGYRHNGIDRVHWTTGTPVTSPSGEMTEWTIMANVAYDFTITEHLSGTLGAGIGADDANLKYRTHASFVHVDDDDWRLAYQGIAGLAYQIGERSQLTLNYRYLGVDSPTWNGFQGPLPRTVNIDADDLGKHAVTIGLRFFLHGAEAPVEPVAEAPPPLPPPEAAPAQSFMIFFGFNKCNITPEADHVLAQAAEAAHQMGNVHVQIVGHTDTKGTPQYNFKLSECRAHAAKANMVAKGVPDGAITTIGKGETELLVQTADEVKEPQNRRATIDLQ